MPEETTTAVKASGSAPPKSGTPLHPLSGAAVLGMDWLLFTSNAVTGGLATPVVSALGFGVGTVTVTAVQRFAGKDSWSKSLAKGLGAGVAVGIPMPIAGTALGGAILGWSGLSLLRGKLPSK